MRERSKQLFGHRYMLEVCLAVGGTDERVCLTDLASAAAVSPSLYSGPVRRLTDLGLLVPVARRPEDDHRTRWYQRAESSLWAATQELRP